MEYLKINYDVRVFNIIKKKNASIFKLQKWLNTTEIMF